MPMATNHNHMLDVESKFWDAMREKDWEATAALTDENCIVVGAQGVSAIDPKLMAKLTEEGKWELVEYEFDKEKIQVRFLTEDIALIAYPVKEHVVVEGKSLNFTANDASVWVRRDGKWRCAMHTESLQGDPFGRDKQG